MRDMTKANLPIKGSVSREDSSLLTRASGFLSGVWQADRKEGRMGTH